MRGVAQPSAEFGAVRARCHQGAPSTRFSATVSSAPASCAGTPSDAEIQRMARRGDPHRTCRRPGSAPLVGLLQARQHADQRRFARAVLAEQHMHFARSDRRDRRRHWPPCRESAWSPFSATMSRRSPTRAHEAQSAADVRTGTITPPAAVLRRPATSVISALTAAASKSGSTLILPAMMSLAHRLHLAPRPCRGCGWSSAANRIVREADRVVRGAELAGLQVLDHRRVDRRRCSTPPKTAGCPCRSATCRRSRR